MSAGSLRSSTARRRVLVVSPHFDDVPLSLGQSLRDGVLSRCEVRVHIAFARTNWTRWMHPTPGRARLVGLWRRLEETVAGLRFGYRWRTGFWSESMLRTGDLDPSSFLDPERDLSDEPLVDDVAAWLASLVGDGPRPDLVLVCAGLGGHVDHLIVAAAGVALADAVDTPVGFYEDRPYSSHLDHGERARQLRALGPDPEPMEVSGPITAATQRWVRRCYPSQIDSYFVHAMERDLATAEGERIWFRKGERPAWL